VARRKAIYEALHPEARPQVRQAKTRWDATANLAPAFTAATAAATGKSERAVQRESLQNVETLPMRAFGSGNSSQSETNFTPCAGSGFFPDWEAF
jgi:hypothetical protein